MIKDLLVSFKDNIKSKTANPFFGTLIVVWLFHNYKFVYTIFNFRSSTGLDDRITFLGTYLESEIFIPNMLWCIGYAILVLIATYMLMNFSRLIVYSFDKKVTPWIKKITDSKSIVSKDEYERQKLEFERVQHRFDQEHEARLKLLTDYEKLDEKYKNILEANSVLAEKLNEEEAKGRKYNKEDEMKPMSDKATALFDKFKPYLNDKEIVKQFKDLSLEILQTNWVSSSYDFNILLVKGLVKVQNKSELEGVKYGFTPKGQTFLEILDHMDDTGSFMLRSFDDMV